LLHATHAEHLLTVRRQPKRSEWLLAIRWLTRWRRPERSWLLLAISVWRQPQRPERLLAELRELTEPGILLLASTLSLLDNCCHLRGDSSCLSLNLGLVQVELLHLLLQLLKLVLLLLLLLCTGLATWSRALRLLL